MLRFGLSVPNLTEPAELVDLGIAAEAAGWDGVFLWEHVVGTPDFLVPMADPWVVLGALATRTERVRLGTTITALPRRQPQEVARQAVSVDRLSGGRLILGVGLGEPPSEYTALGRDPSRPVLAARLDEALEVLTGLWTGEPFDHRGEHFTLEGVQFLPTPLQQPRIPIWTSCITPNRRTLDRAARWDGVLLGALDDAGQATTLAADAVAAAVGGIRARRPQLDAFDVVVSAPGIPDHDLIGAYEDAGATWILATAWLDQMPELAATPPPMRPRRA